MFLSYIIKNTEHHEYIFCLILWYNFTMISSVYTKLYLNLTNGDSLTFTITALAYGACLKLIEFKNFHQIRNEAYNYLYLAVCNIGSLLLTNIARNEYKISFIYIEKV